MSSFSQLPKALAVKAEISDMIRRGDFGGKGAYFLTTRAICDQFDVALKTAHKVVKMLRSDGLLELSGRRSLIAVNPEKGADRQKVIGVMVTNLENPFFASLVKEVENQADHRGWRTVVVSTNYSPERENSGLKMLAGMGVDGILACPCREDNPAFTSCNIPLVYMARRAENSSDDAVMVHNYAAGQEVARHLIEQGFENFAYLGLEELGLDQRLSGFRDSLSASGRKLDPAAIFGAKVTNLDSAEAALISWLERCRGPVGFFCFHDLLAAALLRICQREGFSVPDKVGIVGFDNLPLCTEVYPALSSMAYPISSMATMALDALARRLDNAGEPFGVMHIEAELIARESSLGGAEVAVFEKRRGSFEDIIYHAQ